MAADVTLAIGAVYAVRSTSECGWFKASSPDLLACRIPKAPLPTGVTDLRGSLLRTRRVAECASRSVCLKRPPAHCQQAEHARAFRVPDAVLSKLAVAGVCCSPGRRHHGQWRRNGLKTNSKSKPHRSLQGLDSLASGSCWCHRLVSTGPPGPAPGNLGNDIKADFGKKALRVS